MNVLLLEDEDSEREIVRNVVEEQLRKTALGVASFVEVARVDAEQLPAEFRNPIDLAVIDYELKGYLSGFEALSLLRQGNLFGDPKVIIYTGKAVTTEHFRNALNRGVFAYVVKPDVNELAEAVGRALASVQKDRRVLAISSFTDTNLRSYILQRDGWQSLEAGVTRQMAIMFCDLASSSQFIQQWLALGEEQAKVATLLRDFFTFAADIIKAHGGTIDKYIGDEVMCYFGGSDDRKPPQLCADAVSAAVEIRDGFPAWLRRARAEHGQTTWPKVKLGVKAAVHHGSVVWGLLGSRDRLDVSILTREVIKAARLMQHVGDDRQTPKSLLRKDQKLVQAGEVWVTNEVCQRLQAAGEPFLFDKKGSIVLRNFEPGDVGVSRVRRGGRASRREA